MPQFDSARKRVRRLDSALPPAVSGAPGAQPRCPGRRGAAASPGATGTPRRVRGDAKVEVELARRRGSQRQRRTGRCSRSRRNSSRPARTVLAVELPQGDQHGGVEHADPARRVTGEAEQRRGHEDDRERDEADVRLVRHQHVHGERAAGEIDDADTDLQQRQRAIRQRHLPVAAADLARVAPHPHHVGDQDEQDRRRRRCG